MSTNEAECLGPLFLGFQHACNTLQINLGPEMDRLCDGVANDGWYPVGRYRQLCALVTATYPTPGPVFERMGSEFSRLWYESNTAEYKHFRGVEFLQFHVDSYKTFARGPLEETGKIELVSFSEAEGTALIKSSSIVPRDMERGFYYGGLGLLGDIGFINIETDYVNGLHHVEFH